MSQTWEKYSRIVVQVLSQILYGCTHTKMGASSHLKNG
jgi:hypothetical protein